MKTKRCSKCEKYKSIQEFNKRSKNSSHLQSRCKTCASEYSKNYSLSNSKQLKSSYNHWRSNNPGWRKDKLLQKKFGITLEQYNQMVAAQNNKCAICKQPESAIDRRSNKIVELCVDHCHKTGKIRSLLCNACNRAIGAFRDEISSCLSAAEYLRFHKEVQLP